MAEENLDKKTSELETLTLAEAIEANAVVPVAIPNVGNGNVALENMAGQDGTNGKSAYEIAVDNGFEGTETQWLASLKGADGAPGATGAKGDKGDKGDTGATGPQGPAGVSDMVKIDISDVTGTAQLRTYLAQGKQPVIEWDGLLYFLFDNDTLNDEMSFGATSVGIGRSVSGTWNNFKLNLGYFTIDSNGLSGGHNTVSAVTGQELGLLLASNQSGRRDGLKGTNLYIVANNSLNEIGSFSQSTLRLAIESSAGVDDSNYVVEVTPTVDCTVEVWSGAYEPTVDNWETRGSKLKYSADAGNVMTAGKTYQITVVGHCWTMAEFVAPAAAT